MNRADTYLLNIHQSKLESFGVDELKKIFKKLCRMLTQFRIICDSKGHLKRNQTLPESDK